MLNNPESLQVIIRTDNMTLAGDLIQSLAQYLDVANLQSFAEFPLEEKRCEELMTTLQQLENVKRKLNIELGIRFMSYLFVKRNKAVLGRKSTFPDSLFVNPFLGAKSNLIRNLIIRGEDARLLGDYRLMKRFYQELQDINRELQVSCSHCENSI